MERSAPIKPAEAATAFPRSSQVGRVRVRLAGRRRPFHRKRRQHSFRPRHRVGASQSTSTPRGGRVETPVTRRPYRDLWECGTQPADISLKTVDHNTFPGPDPAPSAATEGLLQEPRTIFTAAGATFLEQGLPVLADHSIQNGRLGVTRPVAEGGRPGKYATRSLRARRRRSRPTPRSPEEHHAFACDPLARLSPHQIDPSRNPAAFFIVSVPGEAVHSSAEYPARQITDPPTSDVVDVHAE